MRHKWIPPSLPSSMYFRAAMLYGALRFCVPTARRVVLVGRGHHLLALPAAVVRRFFDVHVLARLAGPDGRQRVPVVGRRADDRIDRLVIQRLAEILDDLRLAAALHVGDRLDAARAAVASGSQR
jgi:hypothetical protein